MNKIVLIETFCKIVQYKSFTAAAKQLNISAAAVSKQINLLEAELNIALFERTTRKVTLTSIGEAYYQEVQNVFQALEQANSVVAAAEAEPKGLLRVKSSRYFAEHIILPRLPAFTAKYPQLKLDLQIAEQGSHLLEEGLDIAFGISMQVSSNSVQKKISTTRYVFCAAPDYLQRFGVPQNPTDLQRHRFLTHTMREPNNSWMFASGEAIYLEPTLYLNDAAALCDSAQRGLGIVVLHHYQVAKAIEKKELIELFPNQKMPIIPIYLFYHPARFVQPKIRAWIEEMSNNLPFFM